MLALVERVAPTNSTVLVGGESGVGKDLIARAIHEHSQRVAGPFVKINSSAIPETLLESELFGYEKGAFSGASASKPGKFELADKGTLFLDEIGDVPAAIQVKLLRVLQDREFERPRRRERPRPRRNSPNPALNRDFTANGFAGREPGGATHTRCRYPFGSRPMRAPR